MYLYVYISEHIQEFNESIKYPWAKENQKNKPQIKWLPKRN